MNLSLFVKQSMHQILSALKFKLLIILQSNKKIQQTGYNDPPFLVVKVNETVL